MNFPQSDCQSTIVVIPAKAGIQGLAQLAQFEFGFGDFASGGVSQIKWLDG